MSSKLRKLIIIYTAALITALGAAAAVTHTHLEQYRRTARYSAQQAFEAAVTAADGLSRSLRKLSYATDDALGRSICAEARADAMAAEAALSVLPFDTTELEQLSGFINRVGDYAGSLCAQCEDELDSRQREELRTMSDAAAELSGRLSELQGNINDGILRMDSREKLITNIGVDRTEKLSARLLGYESEFASPESIEYDGKYSTQPDKSLGTLTEAEAKAIAAEAAGVEPRELRDEYRYEGGDGRRCYSAGGLYICVSSRGLESMSRARLVGEANIGRDEARRIAEDFLAQRGYDGLALYAEGGSDTVAAFRYAPVQDGAFRPDDYIGISVALDDGSICALDASRYSTDAPELSWSSDEAEAAAVLPEGMESDGSRRMILKSAGGKYVPCYELHCTADDGSGVLVYVNAETGRQWRIELVDKKQ